MCCKDFFFLFNWDLESISLEMLSWKDIFKKVFFFLKWFYPKAPNKTVIFWSDKHKLDFIVRIMTSTVNSLFYTKQ